MCPVEWRDDWFDWFEVSRMSHGFRQRSTASKVKSDLFHEFDASFYIFLVIHRRLGGCFSVEKTSPRSIPEDQVRCHGRMGPWDLEIHHVTGMKQQEWEAIDSSKLQPTFVSICLNGILVTWLQRPTIGAENRGTRDPIKALTRLMGQDRSRQFCWFISLRTTGRHHIVGHFDLMVAQKVSTVLRFPSFSISHFESWPSHPFLFVSPGSCSIRNSSKIKDNLALRSPKKFGDGGFLKEGYPIYHPLQ